MTKGLYALVGMKHRGTEAFVAELPQGEPLTLRRERENKYDPFAVQVWARGQHAGYLKATQVRPVAMAMDSAQSAIWEGRAKLAIDGGKWPMVEVNE